MTDTKRLLVFAGPNGSGKSTLTTPDTLRHFGIPEDRYINADDIARRLRTERPDTTPDERERLAFRRARDLRATYREQDRSFAFETVFSHPSSLLDLQKCRAAGFEVVLLFVTTRDSALNAARVADRVRSGGHPVPPDRIHSRYERTMSLLPRIVEEADRAFIYDNSGQSPTVFALRNAALLPGSDPVPPFLQERLLVPLAQREAERAALSSHLGSAATPSLETGQYTGVLVWLSDHYAAQAAASGLVAHDRLQLTGALPQVGKTATITYRDGSGAIL